MLRNCEAEAEANDEGGIQAAAAAAAAEGDAQGEEATGGDDATRIRGEDADITSLLLLALPLSEGSTSAVRPREPNREIVGEEEPAAGAAAASEPAAVAWTIGESSMAASSVDDFLLTVVVVVVAPRHPSVMAAVAAVAAAFAPDVRALMACGRSVVAEDADGGKEDMARN
jgi:phospholipase/lecithinase/hemolysin